VLPAKSGGSVDTTKCTRTVSQQTFRTSVSGRHFRLHMTQRAVRASFISVLAGAEVLLTVIAEHTSWAKADGHTISVSSFYNSRQQSRMPASQE